VGNAHQLTGGPRAPRTAGSTHKPSATKSWRRTALYGAGTVSMLVVTMATSLSLWIALPWMALDWSPTLVSSGSMEPLVAPGDIVMIRPAEAAELVPNTVVLYDTPGTGRVLHRILEQLPDGTFRTGGDANSVPDSAPVHADDIEGAAVLAVPWVGRPSLWLAEGRYALLSVTALTLVTVLALAPRSFDPAFDPWAGGGRVNPAEVLLGRTGSSTAADRTTSAGKTLLPESLHGLVLDRLAAQSASAQERSALLLRGLS
jgi:signal peptidase I